MYHRCLGFHVCSWSLSQSPHVPSAGNCIHELSVVFLVVSWIYQRKTQMPEVKYMASCDLSAATVIWTFQSHFYKQRTFDWKTMDHYLTEWKPV